MAKRPKWELRVAGIREGGPLYDSWHNAKEALWRAVDRHYHEAGRSKSAYLNQISKAQGQLLADYHKAEKELPRVNLRVVMPRLNDGTPFSIEVNRISG